jgi:hypothetical protein
MLKFNSIFFTDEIHVDKENSSWEKSLKSDVYGLN